MLNGAKSWGRPFTKAAWAQSLQWAQVASFHDNRSVLDRVFGNPGEWLQPKCAFYTWTDQHCPDKYFLWPRCSHWKGIESASCFRKKPCSCHKWWVFFLFPLFPFLLLLFCFYFCGFGFFPSCFILFCSFIFALFFFVLFISTKSGSLDFLIAIKCWRNQHSNISC